MLYFAYGSNLHPVRLRDRVPSARLAGTGIVRGRRLAFHKRGRLDGSGKCDAPRADQHDVVHGALYEIDAGQWPRLCSIEGVGVGYEETEIAVEAGDSEVRAVTFLAQCSHVDPDVWPFDWYRELVVEGARFHRFPETYVSAIMGVPAIPDPDRERSRQHWSLVDRIRSSP